MRGRASRAIALLAGLLLGACSLAASLASAHQGDPDYLSEVTSISPRIPGLSAEIVNYDSDLVVENRSGSVVELEGYEGEPYLRFLPDGTVEVNTRSPAYYLNTDRYGTSEVPAAADPDARPRWKVVAEDGRFDWHDHRSHYMSESLPPQVTDEGQRTKIFDYSIPMRIDGRRGSLDGTLYWVGEPSPSRLPFILIATALLLLVPIAVLIRRRRSASEDDDGEAGGSARPGERGEAW